MLAKRMSDDRLGGFVIREDFWFKKVFKIPKAPTNPFWFSTSAGVIAR